MRAMPAWTWGAVYCWSLGGWYFGACPPGALTLGGVLRLALPALALDVLVGPPAWPGVEAPLWRPRAAVCLGEALAAIWLVVHPGAAVRTVGVSACRTSGGVAGCVVAAWDGVGRLRPSVGVGPGWVRGGWRGTFPPPSVLPAGPVCFAHGVCHGCGGCDVCVPLWVSVCGSRAGFQPGLLTALCGLVSLLVW